MTSLTQQDQLRQTWGDVVAEARRSLPPSAYELWIEPLAPVSASGDTLAVLAPLRVRAWVERRYLELLEHSLRTLDTGLSRILLVVAEQPPGAEAEAPGAVPRSLDPDPRHDFGRFVIGPGNRLAHAAALAVAEAPGDAYNPLFMHGPPGLGKTHLMGAIATYLARQQPQMTIHLTTAERFTSEFVGSLRSEGPERFKQRYRQLDALLIDDVQVLEGKARTEEEFVHTFNALFAAGKQIVISSDRPPGSLARLEERLRDRFNWGLTVAIDPPDLETRTAVLMRLAPEVLDAGTKTAAIRELARRVPGNIRRLEGALTRVLAYSSVLEQPLDDELVERAIGVGDRLAGDSIDAQTGAPTIEAIIAAVAEITGVSEAQILSSQRTPAVARARQLAMYMARHETELSLAAIARSFSRDHSTVLHAIRAVEKRRRSEDDGATVETTINEIHDRLPGVVGGERQRGH